MSEVISRMLILEGSLSETNRKALLDFYIKCNDEFEKLEQQLADAKQALAERDEEIGRRDKDISVLTQALHIFSDKDMWDGEILGDDDFKVGTWAGRFCPIKLANDALSAAWQENDPIEDEINVWFQISELKAEVKRLREALDYYAEPYHWEGKLAREALATPSAGEVGE